MRAKRYPKPRWLAWFLLTKPTSATGELWDRWYLYHQTNHPIRLWLQDSLPSNARRLRQRMRDKYWSIRHRTTDRYDVVHLPTLKPNYYEPNTRMLHACFSLLVDYVEVGLSSKNWEWHEENGPKGFRRFLRKRNKLHCIAAGVAHLDWEMTDEFTLLNHPQQAETARLIKRLYLWWSVERPQRIAPYEEPRIWDGIPGREPSFKRGAMFSFLRDKSPAAKLRREAADIAHHTDEFYDAQDQAMLEKLVAIRTSLWT